MHTPHSPKRRLLPLLIGLAALAACENTTAPSRAVGTPSATAQVRAGDGPVMVPITIRETYAPAPDAVVVPCTPAEAGIGLPETLIATGVGTHLGKITTTLVGTSCTVAASGIVAFIGTAVHTVANGDQLFASFVGTLTPGVLTLSSITFTGGTGRFENATGSASGGGPADILSGTGAFEVEGVISRPNF